MKNSCLHSCLLHALIFRLAALLLVALTFSCRPSPPASSAGIGNIKLAEANLRTELTAAGIKAGFPVSGFIRFRRLGDAVPGVSQSELVAYGDSYGVHALDAPGSMPDEKLNDLAKAYNHISLEKLRLQNEDRKSRGPAAN
jgi:hypothetical protein